MESVTAVKPGADLALKVLVIIGHPRRDSFCEALAEAYQRGAQRAGAEVQSIGVSELQFCPNVLTPSPADQPLEADLQHSQDQIAWADHLVFVYPTWWGTIPAVLKAFLDRVLVPGFAFRECAAGTGFEPLLGGKTAELVTTMDTPKWVYRWIYGKPGHRAMQNATLGFCGIRVVRATVFTPINKSDPRQRQSWLAHCHLLGRKLQRGALSRRQRLVRGSGSWAAALRLQFYPMTLAAYAVGALAAVSNQPPLAATDVPQLNLSVFVLGYLVLFFLEAATVFSNEYFDQPSDAINRYYGPFTGGSRVLVDGRLQKSQLHTAIVLALVTSGILAAATYALTSSSPFLLVTLLLSIAAIGYTTPPVKLAYRGLGEIDVSLTHSIGVLLVGYVLQQGNWYDALPWLLSLPLLVAVMPSIILAGIPDREADARVGKRTLVVRLGRGRALITAAALTLLSAGLAVIWHRSAIAGGLYQSIGWFVVPHAVVLLTMLHHQYHQSDPQPRIDAPIAVALAYILWFVIIPLWHLLS